MRRPPDPDAIVVGAGIVGAACAAALARDGLRVLVLDGRFAAGGTTAAGMGHIVVMDDSAEQLVLTDYSRRLWNALAPTLPANAEYTACGTLWVAETPEQLEAVRGKQALYAAGGIDTEVLGPAALAAAEPALRPGLAGALLVPSEGVVYPPTATLHLLEIARAHGAVVREQRPVDAIGPNVVQCSRERMRAEFIVNATGAEAARLTPGLPIIPRKGHLVITDRHPGLCRHQVVELGYLTSAHVMTTESVAFNVQPRVTGQILIGSSREMAGWDASINRSILRRMVARACHFMPALGGVSAIRAWTGFRPATPDKLPLIGPWESTPGLWVATGHEGLGITTALGTGQLLADLIAGREPAIDPAPYVPSRVTSAMAVH